MKKRLVKQIAYSGKHFSSVEISKAVSEMYNEFPFPPPQRKHTYQKHAEYTYKILNKLHINTKNKVFGDIACGTGLMMLDYALKFPETMFIGYDISKKSVEIANNMFKKLGLENRVKVYLKDIMFMSDKNYFTYIVSWGTIHHLSDPEKGTHLLCRALKPEGILRTGVYGYYGNWERRIQREIVKTITDKSMNIDKKIQLIQDWIDGDINFKNTFTAPPVDIKDKIWVVDEFLHVWEQHFKLKDIIQWLQNEGMRIINLTDYYDNEISLNINNHSSNTRFINRVNQLNFTQQCHLIDLLVRPYWVSLFAQKI